MDLFKKLLEAGRPAPSVEVIEIEDDPGHDYGNVAVYLYSLHVTDRDSSRDYHERQVDVDDFEPTADYTETHTATVVKVVVYIDTEKYEAFNIEFDSNFRADDYFDCDEYSTPHKFDVKNLGNHVITDTNQEIDPDDEQYIVQLSKSYLHDSLGRVLKSQFCTTGTDDEFVPRNRRHLSRPMDY